MRKEFYCQLFSLFLCFSISPYVQSKVWTLDECIKYALDHNIEVKRQELLTDVKRLGVSEYRWNYAPDFTAGGNYSISSGRVLDETTYSFIENGVVGSSSLSVASSLEVFCGFRKLHELKYAQIELESALANVELAQYELRMNVISLYLKLLCSLETVAELEQTVSLLEAQTEKIEVKVRTGKVTEADLLQINTRLYSAKNDVLSASKLCRIAKIDLCQLLDIEDCDSFEVEPQVGVPILELLQGMDMAYTVSRHPEVVVAEFGVDLAKRDLKIAKSYCYPSISLSFGYGSSHSDARQKLLQNNDGTFRYEAYSFFRQYADNASSYVSVSLNIPLFSRMSVYNNIKSKSLAIKDKEYILKSVRKSVEKEILQLKIDVAMCRETYLGAIEQVKYTEEAARHLTIKYGEGATDVLSYLTAVTELVRAKHSLNVAKYTYILNCHLFNELYRSL